jgi:8-amino-7-oxononanoate synthase
MSRLTAELGDVLAARSASGLSRVRRTVEARDAPRCRVDGREMLHFGSNDYLALAQDPRLVQAACEGAARYGVGAGASHLISGHFQPHESIERELGRWIAPCRDARALLFSSGYLANLAIVTALAARDDAVFADRLNHACLNDAALLSRAAFVRYPHVDVDALDRRLAASRARRKLIVTDAVFSMDGDIAPLPRLLQLADAHDAWLVIDDAHGFGVLGDRHLCGRGALAHFEMSSERIVYMATLGKAAGVAGAFVAAHPSAIDMLIQTARSYIFTTASPPMLACALEASVALIKRETSRRAQLSMLIDRWRIAAKVLPWRLLPSETAIQPLVIGDNENALRVSAALWDRGIWIPAIRPPTVPRGSARLRITLTAAHTAHDVDTLVAALRSIAAE